MRNGIIIEMFQEVISSSLILIKTVNTTITLKIILQMKINR